MTFCYRNFEINHIINLPNPYFPVEKCYIK